MPNKNLLSGEQSAGTLEGLGPLGFEGGSGDPVALIANIITTVIGVMTVVAAIYFVVMVISGGISMISSAGDKGAAEDARRKITNGVIGMVVTIAAVFLLSLISTLLGAGNLLDLNRALP